MPGAMNYPEYGRDRIPLPSRQDVLALAMDRLARGFLGYAERSAASEEENRRWTAEQGMRERGMTLQEQQAQDMIASRQGRDRTTVLEGVGAGTYSPEQAVGAFGEQRLGPLAQRSPSILEQPSEAPAMRRAQADPRLAGYAGAFQEAGLEARSRGAMGPPAPAGPSPLESAYSAGQQRRKKAGAVGTLGGLAKSGESTGSTAFQGKQNFDSAVAAIHDQATTARTQHEGDREMLPVIDAWEKAHVAALDADRRAYEKKEAARIATENLRARSQRRPGPLPREVSSDAQAALAAQYTFADPDGTKRFDEKGFNRAVAARRSVGQIMDPVSGEEEGLRRSQYAETTRVVGPESRAAALEEKPAPLDPLAQSKIVDQRQKLDALRRERARVAASAERLGAYSKSGAPSQLPQLERSIAAEEKRLDELYLEEEQARAQAPPPPPQRAPAVQPSPQPVPPVPPAPSAGSPPAAKSKVEEDAERWAQQGDTSMVAGYREMMADPAFAEEMRRRSASADDRNVRSFFRYLLSQAEKKSKPKKKRKPGAAPGWKMSGNAGLRAE